MEFIAARLGAFTWLDLLLLALATWRLSHMISREKGPYLIFQSLRTKAPLGGLTSCIYCLSVWVGFALLILHLFTPIVTWIFAVPGAALMLKSFTGAGHDA